MFSKKLLQYVNPKGPLPELAGTKSGDLLILGVATCLWDDLARYDHLHDGDRMGVNHATIHYPGRLDHAATVHADHMYSFAFEQFYRGARKAWPVLKTHSHIPDPAVKYVWPIHRDGGTSGLFGTLIGLLMGYDRIILAGSPIDESQPFYCPICYADGQAYDHPAVREEWQRAIQTVFNGKVKSLSGWTKEILGEP